MSPWRLNTLDERRKPLAAALATLLIPLILFLDFLTGENSFSIFYLVPIYLFTRYFGRTAGVLVSIASAAGWLWIDLFSTPSYLHYMTPYWNMLVRLGFFLLTVFLVDSLQRAERQRRALEEIFFHDILNIVGSIRGFTELLRAYPEANREEIYAHLHAAAEQSIEEIEIQRSLSALEHRELSMEAVPLDSLDLVRQAVAIYSHHPRASERDLQVTEQSESIGFTSDRALILRILGNLLKNALEASAPGETVTIGAHASQGGVEFRVHNRAVISPAIRPRIFRKNVSTRGAHRGFGTYSVAMLSRFLGGEARFTSDEQVGTTFYVWLPLNPSVHEENKSSASRTDPT